MKHTKIPAYIIVAAAIVVSSTSFTSRHASASTSINTSTPQNFSQRGHKEGTKRGDHGVFGTISFINGNTITLISVERKDGATTTTTYSVDATNAKIVNPSSSGSATSSLSLADLKIGDVVAVQGTITGTSVAATSIFEGKFGTGMYTPGIEFKRGPFEKNNPAVIKARHYQGVVGIVSSVNGSTIIVNGKLGTSITETAFTVNAANAKILKASLKGKATIADIKVGDSVRVSGDVNSTYITAKVILDGMPVAGQLGKSHR